MRWLCFDALVAWSEVERTRLRRELITVAAVPQGPLGIEASPDKKFRMPWPRLCTHISREERSTSTAAASATSSSERKAPQSRQPSNKASA